MNKIYLDFEAHTAPSTCGIFYLIRVNCLQGRTDPMGIRAMQWGPPPKGAHHTSKNNANQQISVAKKAQLAFDNGRNIVRKKAVGAPHQRINH